MLTNILSKICNYLNTNKIPEIIPYLIGKDLETYLNISDLYNIKLLNKELNNDIYLKKELDVKKTLLSNYLQIWKKLIGIGKYFNKTFFPKKLIKLLPVLPCKRTYVGCTDYIDGIRAKDLTYPIMIGVDHFRRPFITIKYKFNKNEYGHITVFQRYTDNKKNWVKCNTKGPLMIHDGSSVFTKEDKDLFINNIIRLICEKKILVNEYWFNEHSTNDQQKIDCKLY